MAVPTVHITNDDSSNNSGLAFTGPGTLLMDADAFLIVSGPTLVLGAGPWTATINGKLTTTGSGPTDAAIQLQDGGSFKSSVIIGATGEVTGSIGVFALHATNVTNKGHIVAAAGYAIGEAGGDYTINNSGTMFAGVNAIDLTGSGTHTIINSGSIEATGLVIKGSDAVEKVTNSGLFTGDVDLGNGNDIFTDFIKIKKHGKIVTHHGTLDGITDLGDGNDFFNGGNNAEVVKDGQGADTYKLSGGDDTLVAAHDTGVDGIDTIDGGAGRDGYDASAYDGTGTFLINLDKKAHGGIAANSVTVGGQTDHIFNFEDVVSVGETDIIYGNASANHIVGDRGAQLFGLGGNDVLEGNAGCQFFGGDGDDILMSQIGAADLYGGAGRDLMYAGNYSGAGVHKIFHYQSISESGVTVATRDVLYDFISGGAAQIDLAAIDAIPATNGDDDFHFIGNTKWGHHAGELRYVSTQTQTIVEADVNGDAKADFSVAIDGVHTLVAGEFIGVL